MTSRAVVLGAVGVIALAVLIPYSDLQLRGTWIAACHLPVGAFFLFLLLILVANPLVARLRRRWALQPGEVVGIYGMLLVGSGIPSFGLAAYLIPTLVGVGYFATAENGWATWFYRFVPQWFVPFDLSRLPNSPVNGLPPFYDHLPPVFRPADPEILRRFYEGVAGRVAVPWEPWVVPLTAWLTLALAIFAVYWALAVLLRRQWVEGERLTFPLVQLPLALSSFETPGAWPPFLRQPAVWAGFAIPTVVHLCNGLHTYFPAVPEIPLRIDLSSSFTTPPWNQLGILWLWVHFSVIGLTFLIPAEFSFSLWFCYLLFKLEGALLAYHGYTIAFMPNYPVPRYAGLQMLGAFLVLAGYLLYAARPHLLQAWREVRRPASSDEPQSYRGALLTGLGGLLGATLILNLAGLASGLALLCLVLLLVVVMVLSRMIAEGGLLFIQAPFRPTDMLLTAVGTGALGPRALTVLAFFERVFCFDLRAVLWPSLLDAFRLADGAGLPRRQMTRPIWLAIGLSMIVSCGAILYTAYRYGAISQQAWFMIASPQQPFQQLASMLNQPLEAQPAHLATVGLGAAVMLALCVARNQFGGFPLHPLGFAMGPSWPLIQLWFSLLLGWGCKSAVLRWGGMKAYRRCYPFFLGLILGEFVAAGCWVIVAVLSGTGTSYRFLLT
ncbi:MAG: hypothetical protein IT204_17435 [Fimbriimonadaceae bacterium]|nr:hypothetical protein [Fimbriimonadaceae bacterium]